MQGDTMRYRNAGANVIQLIEFMSRYRKRVLYIQCETHRVISKHGANPVELVRLVGNRTLEVSESVQFLIAGLTNQNQVRSGFQVPYSDSGSGWIP